jgi:hypothetical protein
MTKNRITEKNPVQMEKKLEIIKKSEKVKK